MAEEVIRMQEETQEPLGPVKTAEQMGTVIAMESVKLAAAENQIQQGETKSAKAEPEKAVNLQFQEEVQKPAAEAAREPIFYDPPSVEPVIEAEPSGGQTEASGRNKTRKRMNDFFRLRKDMEDFTREEWILSRIPEEDLMEYLKMEQKNNEMLRKAKEIKEKRIFTTLQIAISMSAIVGVVALLKDNPTVLVNILYITGIVIALWIWRGKQDK
ncbi:hypothetical protein C808_04254 [Lachnospiraceae bacterium M18-1]|nr:hypothetical protein C808_04254 [Lachnospiraceae bacterium M18-1]